METDAAQERRHADALLDQLPNEKLTAVVHLLQAISNPAARVSPKLQLMTSRSARRECAPSKHPGDG
jgi:hypothetical protein